MIKTVVSAVRSLHRSVGEALTTPLTRRSANCKAENRARSQRVRAFKPGQWPWTLSAPARCRAKPTVPLRRWRFPRNRATR
jgi:hypothetical protein